MAGGRKDWCILRTSGRHTLALAKSLGEDGFEVWTPVETRTVTVPRMNVKREIKLPIMPSYVFAKVERLIDLLQLAELPLKPCSAEACEKPTHPDFSVMHAFGSIPLVADRHLAQLRDLETKLTPRKRAAYTFPRNAKARVNGGIFGGLTGIVVRSTEGSTVLRFDGGFPVEIPTSMLEKDGVIESQIAALKAA